MILIGLISLLAFCAVETSPLLSAQPKQEVDAPSALGETLDSKDGSSNWTDSVTGIELIHPLAGALEKAPAVFKTQIHLRPGSGKLFAVQYENAELCMEINGVMGGCSPLLTANFQYGVLGNATVQAFLKVSPRAGNQSLNWRSAPIAFTLVGETEFELHVARTIEENEKQHRPGFQQSLASWFEQQQRQPDAELLRRLECDGSLCDGVASLKAHTEDNLLLVVGVRTATGSHFAFRQAIRETWASQTSLPQRVKVIFLGCRPYVTVPDESLDGAFGNSGLRRMWEAIELEKQVYGDLLTDELDCDDSYELLASKTKEFFLFAVTHYPTAQYVMVADDDVYLRLDKIAEQLADRRSNKRYYGGLVRAIENSYKIKPVRQPTYRNYLPHQQYPLKELPPFALGANFFLSMDCVEFVAKNHRSLKDLGGMDDISVALWMLAIQVHPEPFRNLEYLTAGSCRDDLLSLSDLSVSSIRVIHANIRARRRLCHGFEKQVWLRKDIGAPTQGRRQQLSFTGESIHLDISSIESENVATAKFIVRIFTPTNAGIKSSFIPSGETFSSYSRRVCVHLHLHFPGFLGSCKTILNQIRSDLQAQP